jgi:NAD(P)-dependent dehydrogenase (short-subunit alcohol dehydrogenase family)
MYHRRQYGNSSHSFNQCDCEVVKLRLHDKVAVVTGAASGIGQAAAIRFAEEGARVVVVDVKNAKETMEQIRRAGSEGIYVHTDVSNEAEVRNTASIVASTYGKVNILFNNAGFMTNASVLEETSEQWDKLLSVNLKGTFFMCKYTIPLMKKAGGGSIINTASVAAIIGHPQLVAYTASKGGIISLTKALAHDHAPDGIRVNNISPGMLELDTPLRTKFPEDSESITKARQSLVNLHPIGRHGTPRDVANVALFLASDESAFVTGSNIVADGGMSIYGIQGERPFA